MLLQSCSLKAAGLSLLFSSSIVLAAPHPQGDEQQTDPGVNPTNTLGTSLTGWQGCPKEVENWEGKKVNLKDFVKAAYKEAHDIVNTDGVKANIHWDSEAAADFFGPPQYNKDQQKQIQAVFANVETMQPGYWFNPFGHSLDIRCDDPWTKKNGEKDPQCRPGGPTAYATNPSGDIKNPYINFCAGFWKQYDLDKAVNNYKDAEDSIKWNVDNYLNRGLVMLHELFHIDLAADSEKGTPNPKIYDIWIWTEKADGEGTGRKKAYTARYAKLFARFLSKNTEKPTGWWAQRNVDNFSRYAMAKYLEGKLGGYPFLPLVYDRIRYPEVPDERRGVTMIGYDGSGDEAKILVKPDGIDQDLTSDTEFDISREGEPDGAEEFHPGKPIDLAEFPQAWQDAYKKWVDDETSKTGGSGGSGGGDGARKPDQGLKCSGIDNKKFMGRDDMADKIKKFCKEAADQGVQDKDSGSIMRKYNGDNSWEVDISMDWPSGTDIKEGMEEKCLDKMNNIMDSCDGNDPKNPMNWKHGGTLGDDVVKYGIYPKKDQSFTPGQCSFKLHQHEDYFGNDGPGTRRDHTYYVSEMKIFGGDGQEMTSGAHADRVECGDGNPFKWDTGLPNTIDMTPEAHDDYIQFTMGSVSWRSSQSDGDAKCKVEDWDEHPDPVFGEFDTPHSGSSDRNMECWMPC